MNKEQSYPAGQPPQHQNVQPGIESDMNPIPVTNDRDYKGSNKLKGKVALITGGDSGIGKAVAIAFAKEGANVVVNYLSEDNDANETKQQVEQEGVQCLLLKGDIGEESFCKTLVETVVRQFSTIDILVNNAAEQHPQKSIEDISTEQMERTFRTNIFSVFHLIKAVLPHFEKGNTIINTSSVTAYKGHKELLDYSATKGAMTTLTRSLSLSLADKGIRVNGVAPGPIWTPLIPSTFDAQQVKEFGTTTPMKRAGQPEELAAAYVYLACDDSSYMTGQMLHINGGEIING
ncbi:SDR family oxidoreductase [Alkalihalobacterium bogoriense]|uniref:SDR family oxidoreductase n=1 Tax=Alkalihalobacterium bogoriense TaxID=246272 RepID=UPI00047B0E6B|nr:SDR family oxidoreductase [Alkalihalobacterium bogoriense]